MSRLAASVALAGLALVGATAPAFASKGHDKPSVCHPTGKGYVVINPAQASSHIDESKFPSGHYWKHEHDGRHDVYAVSGACPVVPSTPTPTTTGGTPSATTTTTATASTTLSPTTATTATAPTSTRPSPSPTSSTSTPTQATTPSSGMPSPSPSSGRPTKSGAATSPSKPPLTRSPASPRRSVPSSIVAPPELARTGFDWVTVFAAALLLLVGALFHGIRRMGAKGTHR